MILLLLACSDYEFHGTPAEEPGLIEAGSCADFIPAGVADPGADGECMSSPAVGTFTPEVEWQWSANEAFSSYNQVMMTPVVAHLGNDDIPDIIFTSYSGSSYTSAGPLNAISGDGSGTLWSVMGAGGHSWGGTAGVAVGDLEGDGEVEVCVAGSTATVVCLSGIDGSFKWAAGTETYRYGAPAIADLDQDGLAEVVLGRHIFSFEGVLLGSGGYGSGYAGMTVPADVDGDGDLEVVAGNAVYEIDGSTLWYDGLADGIPAVADFDGDGTPEIVRSSSGTVILSDGDGTTLWQASIPGGGSGGPPTVADFDGDGEVEVGVAALAYYTVFDNDGSILWSNATEDDSSSVTGSAVFDFEGDGAAEVVYADEHSLYVYDGATGAVLMQMADHASGTLYEYPIIADVDGDGATEIVLGSNNMWWEGWGGITIIGDADSSWAPAREVWNQHAYHITNINNDASVPVEQVENWQSWNSFRAGGTELGPSHWLADLAVGEPDYCLSRCEEGIVEMYVPVENTGLIASGEFTLSLTGSSFFGPVDVHSEAVSSLESGKARLIGPIALTAEDWGEGSIQVVLDEEGIIDECDESDNARSIGGWPCL